MAGIWLTYSTYNGFTTRKSLHFRIDTEGMDESSWTVNRGNTDRCTLRIVLFPSLSRHPLSAFPGALPLVYHAPRAFIILLFSTMRFPPFASFDSKGSAVTRDENEYSLDFRERFPLVSCEIRLPSNASDPQSTYVRARGLQRD